MDGLGRSLAEAVTERAMDTGISEGAGRAGLTVAQDGVDQDVVTAQGRYRDLVNSVDGIVWEADLPAFQFSFVSKQAERILGYPIELWLSEPAFWADHLHADDREWAVHFCRTAVAEKRDHDFEYRMIAADGRAVWVRDLVTVVMQGDLPTRLRGVMVDITERKRAEEERRAHLWFFESMDRINRAIQGSNDLEQMMSDVLDEVLSVMDCDRAWLVYPCDPEVKSWEVAMEHTRPEFPGALALGGTVPMDPGVAALFRTARASSGPIRFGVGPGHPLPTDVASRFNIRSQISMAIYPKGDRPYLFGLHQCSHPRVWTAEEERLFQEIGRRLADALTSLLMLRNLRESEARLEEAQRIAHVGHWERDVADGRVTWSDETYRIFGLVPREYQIDFAAFQALIHPEDRERVVRAASDAARGGPRYDVEYRVVRPSGEVRIVHSQGDVRGNETGAPWRVFGILQDITEQKRAQAAEYLTEKVFESLPDRVSVVGRDYRYRRINPAFERHLKLPATAVVGLHVKDVMGADIFEQKVKPRLDRCFAGEDVSYADWFPDREGRQYLAISYSPLRLDPDRVEDALVIVRDLTDHMLASEALRQAQADLAHISRVTTMGELTASLAHEINQPIAAAVTDANACLRWLSRAQPEVEEAREAAMRMSKDCQRAADIISRVRLLFRKGAAQREPVDVNEVIEEMMVLLRGEAGRYSIPIHADLASGLPRVKADRVQLQQVFMNLMLNGIDAMKDVGTPGQLTITSRRGAGGQLLFSVTDTGVGLPPELTDQIFNAFFTTKRDGTGLGLPISRSIIESHGGRLWAAGNSGRGTTFQFTLPSEAEVGP
jgi:PAS domain S-box-containing protein